ncbi:hypothetical protein HMPREF9554_02190 [Treponema phagedenis F0421]|nr:hypothetical protein HMPREF9554_02190 [Treponema phagedenis F0421]
MAKSERARTPVVPSSSDVLKQGRLQSFKTPAFGAGIKSFVPVSGSTENMYKLLPKHKKNSCTLSKSILYSIYGERDQKTL